MEQRNRIRTVKFVPDDGLEDTRQEMVITTDTIMAEKRSAQKIDLEPHDVPYSCNDARFIIEKKRRRRCAAESATGIESVTPEAQLDEERPPRSSISALRFEKNNLISVKRDHRCDYCGSPDHFSPECPITSEDLLCSFCDEMGHLESVCFRAHPERLQAHPKKLKNPKRAKRQQQTQYAPLQACCRCGSQDHVTPECDIPAEDLHCYFCDRMGHLEKVCFLAHPDRGRNLKRPKHQQHIEYAPLETCNRCGSSDPLAGECDERANDLHCSFCQKAGHADSVGFQVHPERAKNQQDKAYMAQQRDERLKSQQHIAQQRDAALVVVQQHKAQLRDAALVVVQGKDKGRECMRKKNTEGDEKESELVAVVASMRTEDRKLKAERDELKREADAKISSLASANATVKSELDKLKLEIGHQTLSNSTLRSERDDARSEVQDVQTKLDAVSTSFSLLVEKNKELEMEKQEVESAVRNAELRFTGIRERKSLEEDSKKRQSLAIVKSLQADKQKLSAELAEQRQNALTLIQSLISERKSLSIDLDAARTAIQDGKTEFDNKLAIVLSEKENVQKKLALVRGEANATVVALTEQKAEMTKLETALATALTKRENLERELGCVEARGATRVELDRQIALVTEERDHARGAMQDAQTSLEKVKFAFSLLAENNKELETKNQEAENAVRETELRFAETRERKSLEDDMNKKRSLAIAKSVEADLQKLATELREEKKKAGALMQSLTREKISLVNDLDAARIGLDRQSSLLVEERNYKLKMHKTLNILMCRKRKLEHEVSLMKKEAAEDKTNLEQARADLGECRTLVAHLETEIKRLREEGSKLTNLEYDTTHRRENAAQDERKLVRAPKNELDEAITDVVNLERALQSLAEERNRRETLEDNVNLVYEEAMEDKRKEVQAHNELVKARTDIADLESLREEEAKGQIKLVQAHQNEIDMARSHIFHLEKEVESLMGQQYNVNLIQEEADAYKRELMLAKDDLEDVRADAGILQREIVSLRQARNRLEKLQYDVDLLREEEARDKRKLEEAHRIELDEACTDTGHLKTELQSLRNEKNRLQSAHEDIKRKLEEEKEKSLCQICMELPKDTISFPCLHLHYCFSCLEKHKKQNNSCPSCRAPISGLLKSDILA